MTAAVRFDGVVRDYDGRRGVDGVTFEVEAGSVCVLLGPSGCGKTTLLKTVNRLLEPTDGRVFVDGTDVATVDPVRLRRRIGYAIQAVGLFPHMRVEDNVAVVPTLLGWDTTRVRSRVAELLELVHLPAAEFARRFPRELSGGQQQRVGLARALAGDPAILLMDEPFGAVDAVERSHLQAELRSLQRKLGKTVLFVTHDVEEALRLADAIVVMRDGKLEQRGTPLSILARPATPFVADLVDAHDAVRLLGVVSVADAATEGAAPGVTQAIERDATLRDALSLMAESGVDRMVVRADGAPVGVLTFEGMLAALRRVRSA